MKRAVGIVVVSIIIAIFVGFIAVRMGADLNSMTGVWLIFFLGGASGMLISPMIKRNYLAETMFFLGITMAFTVGKVGSIMLLGLEGVTLTICLTVSLAVCSMMTTLCMKNFLLFKDEPYGDVFLPRDM